MTGWCERLLQMAKSERALAAAADDASIEGLPSKRGSTIMPTRLRHDGATVSRPATAFRCIATMQILCALREGAFGSHNINALVARTARASASASTPRRVASRPAGHRHAQRLCARFVQRRCRHRTARRRRHCASGSKRATATAHPRCAVFPRARCPRMKRRGRSPFIAVRDRNTNTSPWSCRRKPDHRVLSRELIYTAMSRAVASV